ncbi:uncharacterized protein LOC118512983 [Anopheles stephensi]|uniref:uncharacterized protein LOC118512983 n=1 Tax=Anopheles stephensi TaxID=30069 RepID=UPI001658B49E|nr:uncharacterized protein LOC118512983 [Anopheles stephensi]
MAAYPGVYFSVIVLCLCSPTRAGLFQDFKCYSWSEVCRLKEVVLESEKEINTATFSNIRDPLVIESGTIPQFSDELFSKLSAVSDLTIDRVGIKQLFVRSSLLHLSAVGNAIDTVVLDSEATVFSMLTLHLSHNKLTSLPPLDRFVRLMTLVVDHNLLTSIDMGSFGPLSNLRALSLAHNLLLTVTSPPDTPMQLIKLRRLSFAGNQLAMLDIRTWELDSLEVFNVTGNSLTRIEGSFTKLPVLRRLELARNRWYCEWLMMLYTETEAAPGGFRLDSDEPDRCRDENMITSHHHCCNPAGAEGSGLVDIFGEKWDELKRLSRLLDTLNSTVANGSASVNRVLNTQNASLSTQIANISETQREQTAQLRELERGIDRLKDRLTDLQSDLKEKVDRLSLEVNGRWNDTIADAGELSNATQMTTGPTNWPAVASENEKNLSRLRELLVTTTKQFNDYASRTFEQEALVKSQRERIDTVQQELDKERSNGKQMQQQMDKLVKTVDLIYNFLREVRDGSVEKLD